jgi:hypothetical protein
MVGKLRDYSNAVEWLLKSKDPSIRYLTLREVLERSEKTEAVRRAKSMIPQGEKVKNLLKGQKTDGGFAVHPYRKWTGSHWRLVSLVNLGISPDNEYAIKAARLSVDWLYSAGIKRAFKPVNGRTRMHASVYGNAVYYWSYFGLANEPRVKSVVQMIMRAQWEDGGWNCDPRPEATHSSFHESLATLNGLVANYKKSRGGELNESINRASEFFLSHHIYKSHRTGEVGKQEWLKLKYPVYWHYNFLESMRVLCSAGRQSDFRMNESLDLLEEKCNKDGKWYSEGNYWTPIEKDYLSLNKSSPNREVVDWGRYGPNEMITLNALRVLKSTGRME